MSPLDLGSDPGVVNASAGWQAIKLGAMVRLLQNQPFEGRVMSVQVELHAAEPLYAVRWYNGEGTANTQWMTAGELQVILDVPEATA